MAMAGYARVIVKCKKAFVGQVAAFLFMPRHPCYAYAFRELHRRGRGRANQPVVNFVVRNIKSEPYGVMQERFGRDLQRAYEFWAGLVAGAVAHGRNGS